MYRSTLDDLMKQLFNIINLIANKYIKNYNTIYKVYIILYKINVII